MSIFHQSGLSSRQLAELTSDSDLAAAVSTVVAQVTAAAPVAMPGEVRLFNNTTGFPPGGWSSTGQSVPTSALWASSRLLTLPYRAAASLIAPTASSLGTMLTAISETHNRLFLFNGINTGAKRISMWDLGTFAWTQSAQHPSAAQLGAMAKAGGYLYTGGGFSTSNTTSSVYRYNIATDSFTSLARPAAASRDWALLPLADGKVIAAGGCTVAGAVTATNMSASVHVYDPVANGWTTRTAAPLSFCMSRSASIGNGKFLLRCDYTSNGTTLNSTPLLLMYDYPADAWTIVEALPAGYSSAVSVSATPDGRGLVFCSTSPTGLSCALMYDPTAAVGSRFTPYDAGDTDTLKFNSTSSVIAGSCLRDYAGCVYVNAFTATANVTSPVLLRFGADVPVARNFYAVKN